MSAEPSLDFGVSNVFDGYGLVFLSEPAEGRSERLEIPVPLSAVFLDLEALLDHLPDGLAGTGRPGSQIKIDGFLEAFGIASEAVKCPDDGSLVIRFEVKQIIDVPA